MEVSRQNGSCGCHFRGLHDVGRLQRLLTPGRHQPSLSHVISSKAPSRDPSDTRLSKTEDSCSTRTLEGVLRGQVPSIFSNLCRNTQSEDAHAVKTKAFVTPASSPVSAIVPVSSPRLATSPVTPYTLKRTYTQIEQQEPIDLSCKKMRSDMGNSRVEICSVESCIDGPEMHQTYPGHSPSPRSQLALSGQKGQSLLRNLLCIGKDLDASQFVVNSDNTPSNGHRTPVQMERTLSNGHFLHARLANSASTLGDWSHSRISKQNEVCVKNNTGNTDSSTKVTLAKKNMLPVSARVSDWLVKIIRFAKSIPEFMSLLHNDKLALILNSWARLLLLYMAENNFQFAVTPDLMDPTPPVQCPESAAHQENPTMKSVESVQSFIRKCQNMGTDSKEYAFLRMAVLFNAGIRGLDRPDMVDRVNSSVQQLLQQHVQASRPRDYMHYSRLLMSLPALYGINCKMIENLFCRHINGNMDMDVLLKEMLQNI